MGMKMWRKGTVATRMIAGAALAVLLTASVAACSDGGNAEPSAPSQEMDDHQGEQTPELVTPSGNGLPSSDEVNSMLPTAEELPAGWKLSGADSVGWRDAAEAQNAAGPFGCGASPLEAAEVGLRIEDAISAGNEDKGDGAFFQLNVPTGEDGIEPPSSVAEATRMIEENLPLKQKLYACWGPKPAADDGGNGLTFDTQRFTHIFVPVGPVEVVVHAPVDGKPTAQEWASVLEQRVRAVLEGSTPTARATLR
ncbi:hypothetical protein [Streptomyces sp. NPDC060366]|uniref:hypothetical protein n=1 Tax=Streptomyces sp. NPDC060366 TaxID=3347105 RepID=UPI0036619F49